MAAAQRVGDTNSAGGVAQGGISSVRINGRPIIVSGNPVTPHPCCGRRGCPPIHCSATTSGGSGTVKAGGISIIRTGDVDTCGHPRSGGSGDVNIG
jgi:uncharacterized Zn-binding protein involved in type VI secretion